MLPVDVPRDDGGRAARARGRVPRRRRPPNRPAAGRVPEVSAARSRAGELKIARALEGLDVAVVQLDAALLVNVNTRG